MKSILSGPVRSILARPLAAAALGLLLLGAGVVAGVRSADESERIGRLEASASALASRAGLLQEERNRLRAERNTLEARLAAGDDPPAVCPQEFVSTADGELLPSFSVDYRCGWSVLYDPRSQQSVEDRPGLRVEVVLFSRLPISLVPRTTPPADVEVGDWTDNPADAEDKLPPLEQWLEDERKRFAAAPREDRVEVGGGGTAHRLSGTVEFAGEPTPVTVLLWEYEDAASGARHILRAFAVAPSAETTEALDRLVRSFSVRRR